MQRRNVLSRAGRADQAEHLPLAYLQGDPLQHLEAAEVLVDIDGLQHEAVALGAHGAPSTPASTGKAGCFGRRWMRLSQSLSRKPTRAGRPLPLE